jgi:hypothetical protein
MVKNIPYGHPRASMPVVWIAAAAVLALLLFAILRVG